MYRCLGGLFSERCPSAQLLGDDGPKLLAGEQARLRLPVGRGARRGSGGAAVIAAGGVIRMHMCPCAWIALGVPRRYSELERMVRATERGRQVALTTRVYMEDHCASSKAARSPLRRFDHRSELELIREIAFDAAGEKELVANKVVLGDGPFRFALPSRP